MLIVSLVWHWYFVFMVCWFFFRFSLGILLTYYSIKMSFILTVLTYGFVFGAGVGIAYAPPLACAMKVSLTFVPLGYTLEWIARFIYLWYILCQFPHM